MTAEADVQHRLMIARDCLKAARNALGQDLWWLAAQQAQMCVENAAKAACAESGPPPRSHEMVKVLEALGRSGSLPPDAAASLVELASLAGAYGHEAHIRFSYGSEEEHKAPSEMVGPEEAQTAVADATRALELVDTIRATAVVPTP